MAKKKSAVEAFRKKDVDMSREVHQDPEKAPINNNDTGYVNEFVLGATDGIVTTFAVVSGSEGANLPVEIILILGISNLVADGLSMAVGTYMGVKAQGEFYQSERRRELWEIENIPEEEEKEIRHILTKKGVRGEDLDLMTEKVTKYPKLWVDMMMSEELNLAQDNSRPFSHALVTFIAFLLAGSIPLAGPIAGYFSETILANGFTISVGLTVVALLLVGIVRARITFETWWRSMLELLFLGGLAASVAYGIGYGLKALIGYSI